MMNLKIPPELRSLKGSELLNVHIAIADVREYLYTSEAHMQYGEEWISLLVNDLNTVQKNIADELWEERLRS